MVRLSSYSVLVLIDYFDCPDPQGEITQLRALGGEVLGGFIISIFVLIIVHDTTTIIRSILWSYILIPIVYFIAREATYQIDGLNPASVLAEQIFVGIKYHRWSPLKTYWIFFFGPMVGSAIAAVFFNYFYLPLFRRWKSINTRIT